MKLLNSVSYYINLVGITAIITLIVVAAVLYYMVKVKKVVAKEENIDTSSFKRKDSISYIPIKDLLYSDGNLDSPGMIILPGNVFVGGVTVRGFEYPSASMGERLDAQINSVSFFNVVEQPISFRQTTRSIDLSPNIKELEEVAKNIERDLIDLEADFNNTLSAAEDYIDEPEVYQVYATELAALKKKIYAKTHMLNECKAEVGYMNAMSEDSARSDSSMRHKEDQIMFSYQYNADDYTTELSKEEIYVKANDKLNMIASSYAEALSHCHFRARRLTARELFKLLCKHTSPLTGEDRDLDELLDSSYTNLFVSSDSLVETIKEKIGEDIYNEQMREYERQLEEYLKQQELMLNREARVLEETATAIAEEEYFEGGLTNG